MDVIKGKAQGRADLAAVGAKSKPTRRLTAGGPWPAAFHMLFIDGSSRVQTSSKSFARGYPEKVRSRFHACCPFHNESHPLSGSFPTSILSASAAERTARWSDSSCSTKSGDFSMP